MSEALVFRPIFILLFLFGQISYRHVQKRTILLQRMVAYIPKIVYFGILIPSLLMLLRFHERNPKIQKTTAFSRDISYIFFVGSNLTTLIVDLLYPSEPYLLYKQIIYIITYTSGRIGAINTQKIKRKFIRRLWIGVFPVVGNIIVKLLWKSLFTPPIIQVFVTTALIYRLIALLHSIITMDSINCVMSALIANLEENISVCADCASRKERNNQKMFDQIVLTFKHMKWIHFKLFTVSELYNKR